MAFAVIDIAEQPAVGEVEAFVRQLRRHQQAVVFDPRGGNQGGDVRGQALLDGILQRQAERPLHGRQQAEHEQHRQGGGASIKRTRRERINGSAH
jgi:hypothetical protein